MKKLFLVLLFSIFLPLNFVFAQENLSNDQLGIFTNQTAESSPEESDIFYKAKVESISKSGFNEDGSPYQVVSLKIIDGQREGQLIEIGHGLTFPISEKQLVKVGQTMMINEVVNGETPEFYIADFYRMPGVQVLFLCFVVLCIITAGMKGFRALLALASSVLLIIYVMLPLLLNGYNPSLVAFGCSTFIMLLSLLITYGLKKKMAIAFGGMFITIFITLGLSELFINLTHLLGLGTEEAFFLQNDLVNIDLRGLLLAGVIIGTLGVLDDVATTQVATVIELKRANKGLNSKELYTRAISVGREHIASLINTLAMAYAGTALPLLLLISINLRTGIGVVLNSEMIVEEVLRALIGSMSLIIAVPIVTLIAAWVYGRHEFNDEDSFGHLHIH